MQQNTLNYKGNVYDVTDFVSNHPGGNLILKSGGKDLEKVWNELGYGWHNQNTSVKDTLKKYKSKGKTCRSENVRIK